jgi:hypothetical protein
VTLALAHTFAGVASAIVFAALLVPVAIAVWRRAAEGPDPVQSVGVGVAFAAALLVAVGLLLSLVGGIGSAGWLAAILIVDAALLLGTGDRRSLARRTLPALLGVAALAAAVGAVAISHESAVDDAREHTFTQLWMLPRAGGDVADLGVRNQEGAAAVYRLTVRAPESAGGEPLLEREVRIGASRTWVGSVSLPPTDRPEQVTAELFRLGGGTPYRTVHVWTPAGP